MKKYKTISALFYTYVIVVVEGIEHVIRQTREEIDDEPTAHIIHANDLGVRNHFPSGPHESRMEVEDNVNEEDDVDDAVQNEQRHILRGLVFKGHVIRDHYGCIESEAEDYPIPDGFKGAIV
ncbi:hypothetical protein TNCV_4932391 [Trichonephila clavipes]|nr:hypothetical protein TNCV_4932391 [Trichonephila clavipes]